MLGADFLESDLLLKFNRIIANPPFSKNQDIDHIQRMYQHLDNGGRLVSFASTHWQFANGKKETAFRKWLDIVGGVYESVEASAFKESGTNIATCIITINRN